MKKLLLILSIVTVSCSDEKKVENEPVPTTTSNMVDISAPDSITKSFVIPDSINANLIIATYVEIDPESHTLLIYTDNTKKKAIQVRYLNDGGVDTDKLDVVSDTVLRTKGGNEFRIRTNTVLFKLPNGNPIEHYRTDANN